jgi:hypothetical protein
MSDPNFSISSTSSTYIHAFKHRCSPSHYISYDIHSNQQQFFSFFSLTKHRFHNMWLVFRISLEWCHGFDGSWVMSLEISLHLGFMPTNQTPNSWHASSSRIVFSLRSLSLWLLQNESMEKDEMSPLQNSLEYRIKKNLSWNNTSV